MPASIGFAPRVVDGEAYGLLRGISRGLTGELCEEPLDMLACSQCGVDAFVRTCEHGGARPIRPVEGALYCLTCRP